ncbi:hypothetical protein [Chitiniphilus shinanonensis]|uniref:hypothetical protein n=1 Tax=Chitiniphilus shinanonensis TaxID=553088 RepID=UPI00302F18E4
MKLDARLKPTLIAVAFFGALGLASCGGGGGDGGKPTPTPTTTPTTVPTPTPTPTPPPLAGWISYNAAAGVGTAWYDTDTGAYLQNGTDNCADKPVALDFRPSDGVLMGMAADGKLMTIDETGTCDVVNTGAIGTALAALGQPVIGFAVNPAGVYAVLADDGANGRLITFKEGDAAFKSDTTLWTGATVTPTLTDSRAFGIDFMDTGDTNRLVVATRKAVIPNSDECGSTHLFVYDADGALVSDTAGGKSCYSRYNPGNNDIAIANGRLYLREGNNATAAGYVVNFDPITHVQSRYNADNYVLWLDRTSTTNPTNTALAVRFPAGDN